MNSKSAKIWRFLLLLFGYGIIVLCYCLFASDEVDLSTKLFVWINIAVVYSFIFIPFFLSDINVNNIDKKVPSLVFVWSTVGIFDIIVIGLIILVAFSVLSVKIGLVIEIVILFIEAIFIFFGYLGNSHVVSVQNREKKLMSCVVEIRNSLELIVIKSASLPDSLSDEKSKITKFSEDVRYMAPADNEMALGLEKQILSKIGALSNSCDLITSGGDTGVLKSCISDLEILIKQRKLLFSR